MFRGTVSVVALLASLSAAPAAPIAAEEKVLFDFETDADLAKWSHLVLEDKKLPGAGEPETKLELSTESVTSGKHRLRITFNDGRFPRSDRPEDLSRAAACRTPPSQ